MQPKRRRQQTRPTLFADDYLAPGERQTLGDDEAMSLAYERHLEASRRYRPQPITEGDLAEQRPDDLEHDRDDETAREQYAWRAAVIAGRLLAWRADSGPPSRSRTTSTTRPPRP